MAKNKAKQTAEEISADIAYSIIDGKSDDVLISEIGQDPPLPTTVAGVYALKKAKEDIAQSRRRAQELDETDIKRAIKTGQQAQEVQEPTITAEQAQKVQEATPHMMRRRIDTLAFMMDYLKNPEDTLLEYNVLTNAPEMYDNIFEKKFLRYVGMIAKKTGADPEQIKDPERRTEEQAKMLLELSAREQLARFDAFFNSNYMQATEALEPLKGRYADPEPADDYTIKQYAVLYFFANHYPDIKPQTAKELTAEQIAEVIDNFNRLDAFYYEQSNGGEVERTKDFFTDFVSRDNPNPAQILKLLPRIMATPPDKLDYPTDKINNGVWEDLAAVPKNSNGQIMFATEKRGSKKEATVLYSIDFEGLEKLDGLKLTKSLTAFDKRVYIAVSAIYTQGGQYMSAGQVFTAMGGRGKPSAAQIQRINDSLTKMGAAHIYLDNSLETPVNKSYPAFKYDAALLPFERVSAYINNALVESAIHLFREPPLMTFARERRQITTVTRKLLEIPLNQSEDNLTLEDYLIERIASMKKPGSKQSRKMLFATIYEKCKIDGKGEKYKKARQRTPEKIRKILDHFTEQGYIAGYVEAKDGITIDP